MSRCNDESPEIKCTKRNINIKIISLVIAFIAWASGTYLLWTEQSHFVSLLVLALIIGGAVTYFIDWRRFKNN
jgi:hypothetical protein